MNQSNIKKIKIEGEFTSTEDIYLNILCPLLNSFCKENNIKFSGYIENIEYKEDEINKVTIS